MVSVNRISRWATLYRTGWIASVIGGMVLLGCRRPAVVVLPAELPFTTVERVRITEFAGTHLGTVYLYHWSCDELRLPQMSWGSMPAACGDAEIRAVPLIDTESGDALAWFSCSARLTTNRACIESLEGPYIEGKLGQSANGAQHSFWWSVFSMFPGKTVSGAPVIYVGE